MTKTILVTGGAGAIGSSLVNTLAKEPGNRLVILDNLSSGRQENIVSGSNVQFIQGSVEMDEDLAHAFTFNIDAVYHLAANFANQNSVEFPQRDLRVNGMGTLKLLLKSAEHKVKRFIYSSSSCVYGNRDESLSEQCREFSLDTPYGITKLLGEQYVRFFHVHHNLPVVILRYFNVFGPNEYPGHYRNVISNFIYLAMKNEELTITGTGDETRDFNYMDDTVRGTILAAESDVAIGQTFNIASGHETRIKTVLDTIIRLVGSKSKIVYKPRRSWDTIVRRVADVQYAKKVLGYEPKISVEEGLRKYCEWMKDRDFSKCKW